MAFLEFQGVTKRFPGVLALTGVTFGVEKGSCHALMGENGAGKSTLGKILAGILRADAGEIRLDGTLIQPTDPLAARQLGIAIVHQELAFCPNLSVAENLCLGDLPTRRGWLDRRRLRENACGMLREIALDLEVDQLIRRLSVAQEQLVQIAAAVGTNARVIVMDEPTSSLSLTESEKLFRLIGALRARGLTILYVSHRMEEIFRLCNDLTVLRDGTHVATGRVAETTPEQVIQQMVGRRVEVHIPRHLERPPGAEVLRVENLCSDRFRGIGFSLRAGEVLGLAGLVGAGRSEVGEAIFGLDRRATGRVRIADQDLPLGSVDAALDAGLGLVTEDRKRTGLVLTMNCRENASLPSLPRLTRLGWIQRRREREMVAQYAARLRVKAPSFEVCIATLSGGNQQKISLAKWLARQCRILIVDEPTRGIDVGAKSEIHDLLDELACQGLALIVISSELSELIRLSRRILVICEGGVAGELERPDFSSDNLMRLMAGMATGEVKT